MVTLLLLPALLIPLAYIILRALGRVDSFFQAGIWFPYALGCLSVALGIIISVAISSGHHVDLSQLLASNSLPLASEADNAFLVALAIAFAFWAWAFIAMGVATRSSREEAEARRARHRNPQ